MTTIDPALHDRTASPFQVTASLFQPSRLRAYLLRAGEVTALVAFLSFCVMWVQWQASSRGFYNVSGDFVGFWTAGELALEGHAADAYREMPHFFKQLALHGDPSRLYLAFFYPPYFLLLCAGFALLGFFTALCAWLITTCVCYVAAIRALLAKALGRSSHVWVLFLGYPAVMVNIGFGQNGFLSTALMGGAAVWLDRRPELAGVCLGCLAYKPQLGIIVPLALAVAQAMAGLRCRLGNRTGPGGRGDIGFRLGYLAALLRRHGGGTPQLAGSAGAGVLAVFGDDFRCDTSA